MCNGFCLFCSCPCTKNYEVKSDNSKDNKEIVQEEKQEYKVVKSFGKLVARKNNEIK